jgi:hypothetical protein
MIVLLISFRSPAHARRAGPFFGAEQNSADRQPRGAVQSAPQVCKCFYLVSINSMV